MLYATIAITALSFGLLTSRFDLSTGMTLMLPRASYLIPNSMLCDGTAVFFCLFAFLYSIWIVPWSAQAAMSHFTLSLLYVGMFLGMERFRLGAVPPALAIPLLLTFS
jgi:hypothetical protein